VKKKKPPPYTQLEWEEIVARSLLKMAKNRIARMRRILKRLEWITPIAITYCPSCLQVREEGHAKSCPLARELKVK
jgi:hypothetical protein